MAVVGGGTSGLAAALFLARRGRRVTVLEREPRSAGTDLDADFLHWRRPRSPQALQPHSLLGPVRAVLRDVAPDVYAEMLRRGAVERHELARFGPFPAAAGDEDLVTLRARRIVLEAALGQAVRAEPAVRLRTGAAAEGLLVAPGVVPRVTGVRTAAGDIRADLVIDAAGRRSPVPRWLARAGARPAHRESQETGIAYFCRWYRLPPGARDAEPLVLGTAAPYANCGVFPSDNGYFALALTVSVADPTRGALRDPRVFDSAAKVFPAGREWLSRDHRPVSPVHVMAGLNNQWTALVDGHGPQVTGLIGIGDSAVHTNPTLGQGIPLALRAARWVAHHDPGDPDLPTSYHRWRLGRLRPWFDAQVAADRAGRERLRAGVRGAPPPVVTGDALLGAAMPACARDDLDVARARAQVRHLVRTPDEVLADPRIRARLQEWLRGHPHFDGAPDGPDRSLWDEATRVRPPAAAAPP
ncbi:NAD(P)/FAD-dependent oxidoreductase [Streptomyces sp. NPDC020983]|uniref:NAD(P)/FAD-dependent oxidoreductase n=1 Tax=Streptomyces sp. NPDC020983 TaxID=3365106 RepID=UPI0037AC6067